MNPLTTWGKKKSTSTIVWDDAVLGCHGRRWSKKRWRGRRKEGRWEGVPVECRLKLHGEWADLPPPSLLLPSLNLSSQSLCLKFMLRSFCLSYSRAPHLTFHIYHLTTYFSHSISSSRKSWLLIKKIYIYISRPYSRSDQRLPFFLTKNRFPATPTYC